MHDYTDKIEKLCKMKEILEDAMEAQLLGGLDKINTMEAGQVIDMIKDLYEAEKNYYKALYYCTVVKQMHEGEEDGMTEMPDMPWYWKAGKMGYDHWRYSSGRYAPKGRGHYSANIKSGYPMPEPYPYNPAWPDEVLGYPMNPGEVRSEYGRAYDMFRDSKRHYTETHSEHDREEMKQHGKEHVMETVATIKEIWSEADPELRKQMKDSIVTLVNDMK